MFGTYIIKVIFSLYPLFIIPPSTLKHTSQPLLLCYHYILGYLQSTKRIIIWNLVINTIHEITLGSMDSQDFLSEILERRLGQGWWVNLMLVTNIGRTSLKKIDVCEHVNIQNNVISSFPAVFVQSWIHLTYSSVHNGWFPISLLWTLLCALPNM